MPSGDKFDAANLSAAEIAADTVFRAIADIKRRRIIEIVQARPGIRVTEVCNAFPVSRFAILKHLNILEEAGLIERSKHGTTKRLRFCNETLRAAISPWLDALTASDRS